MNLEPICKSVDSIRFGCKALSLLQPFLGEKEESCSEVFLNKPMLLMLDSQFKTLSGNRRFTQQALRDVCFAVSPNLYHAIVDVAAFSKAEAAVMFSMAVKGAFNVCLNGKTLKVNNDNEIVALAEHKTTGYSSSQFFDYVNRTVELCKKDMHVREVVVNGEKLSVFVRYETTTDKRIAKVLGDVAYALKIDNKNQQDYKSNSLVVKFGSLGFASVGTSDEGSLKERLYYGFNTAKIFDDSLALFVAKASAANLKFTGDKSKDDYRARDLRARLMAIGIPSEIATRVIKRTFYTDKSVVFEKTFLDLFLSVLCEQSCVGTTAKAKRKLARAVYRFVVEREVLRG